VKISHQGADDFEPPADAIVGAGGGVKTASPFGLAGG